MCGTPGRDFELDGTPNLGYKPRYKEGYFPVPPMDSFQDLRSEMVRVLEQVGISIEVQHHEVGTAGQAEIDMRFDELAVMADKLMLYKYVVKNVARQRGYSVTFMPKPIFQDNGSGHARAPVVVEGRRAAVLRREGLRRSLGHGPLVHRRAAQARGRAVRVHEPDHQLLQAVGAGLRGAGQPRVLAAEPFASVRIPLYSKSPKAKRLECRFPDPSCNPYLAFSAMLMAGLDGIANRTEPPTPVDRDLYDLPPEELAKVPQVPGSLGESLDARSRPTTSSCSPAVCSRPT